MNQRLMFLIALSLIAGFIGYRTLVHPTPEPTAIFVLGGEIHRERVAAQLARQYPNLPIWISSGSPADHARSIFAEANISLDRLHLDYRAVDTVTNFTTLVDDFDRLGIQHVYLVTSDYHMRRALTIETIVFGSRGIDVTPISVPTTRVNEPLEKSMRDGMRSLLWLTTGRTGASIGKTMKAQKAHRNLHSYP